MARVEHWKQNNLRTTETSQCSPWRSLFIYNMWVKASLEVVFMHSSHYSILQEAVDSYRPVLCHPHWHWHATIGCKSRSCRSHTLNCKVEIGNTSDLAIYELHIPINICDILSLLFIYLCYYFIDSSLVYQIELSSLGLSYQRLRFETNNGRQNCLKRDFYQFELEF